MHKLMNKPLQRGVNSVDRAVTIGDKNSESITHCASQMVRRALTIKCSEAANDLVFISEIGSGKTLRVIQAGRYKISSTKSKQ